MRLDVATRSKEMRTTALSIQSQTPADMALRTISSVKAGPPWPCQALKLAIFAEYCRPNTDSTQVEQTIKVLIEHGWKVLRVKAVDDLTSSLYETEDSQISEEHLPYWAIVRSNLGHDFGSWRTGLDWAALQGILSNCTRLMFLNDSIRNWDSCLADVVQRLDPSIDMMSLTESLEILPHGQSYFMVFSERAIRHPCFMNFWETYNLDGDRQYAVLCGEIRLSAMFARHNLSRGSVVSYAALKYAFKRRCKVEQTTEQGVLTEGPLSRANILFALNSGVNLNPVSMFWRELILDFNLPIAKNSLIDAEPPLLQDANEIVELLKSWITR
jgi:hypothetical protein